MGALIVVGLIGVVVGIVVSRLPDLLDGLEGGEG